MIVIIDYGIGNLTSIRNMLYKTGCRDVSISNSVAEIASASKLILPGVGHFDYGMKQLKHADFFDTLNIKVLNEKTPILGICLGAQLLTKGSEEGHEPGLGWIPAYTKKFDSRLMNRNLKIPHMGWSEVSFQKKSYLSTNMPPDSRFYFVHSFHIVPELNDDILMTSFHGHSFVAAVEKENILGVQFHPEKSHKFGLQLLNNFINHY